MTIPSFQIVRKNNKLQCAVTCNEQCENIPNEITWFLGENETVLESSKLFTTSYSINYVVLSDASFLKSLKATVNMANLANFIEINLFFLFYLKIKCGYASQTSVFPRSDSYYVGVQIELFGTNGFKRIKVNIFLLRRVHQATLFIYTAVE